MRLIADNGDQLGILPKMKAFEMAKEAGLDLVIVAEKSMPPVCRILDYGKLRYEQKQNLKKQKKNQHAQKLKEIRFRVNIDDHDYNYKVNHAKGFLSKGYKVKLALVFRGREAAHKDIGFEIIKKTLEDLKEYGNTDSRTILSGRTISVALNPIK